VAARAAPRPRRVEAPSFKTETPFRRHDHPAPATIVSTSFALESGWGLELPVTGVSSYEGLNGNNAMFRARLMAVFSFRW
jgi:hypothetical protein